MPIVLITDSLLSRASATDGRILRDRMLSGFCVRLKVRKRTFLIATSVSGVQFRMMLGYWPLMSVEEAHSKAMDVLSLCRRVETHCRQTAPHDLRKMLATVGEKLVVSDAVLRLQLRN